MGYRGDGKGPPAFLACQKVVAPSALSKVWVAPFHSVGFETEYWNEKMLKHVSGAINEQVTRLLLEAQKN